MDIMDKFPEMKGYFIIMDNAPIHVPEMIEPIIMQQGYTSVYFPPYSSESSPSFLLRFGLLPSKKLIK